MAEWDRRIIAALFIYSLGFLLWFIGFLSPDVDELPPSTQIKPPTAPVPTFPPKNVSAENNLSNSAFYGEFASSYHEKLSIATFFFKTMINVGTIGVPIMGMASIVIVLISAKMEKLVLIGGFAIVSGFLALMFILAAFFAISETDTIFNRVMEGVGTIFCFGALVGTSGVSYMIYKDQKHIAARGYSVYRDDVEEQKGLVDDGLADDS